MTVTEVSIRRWKEIDEMERISETDARNTTQMQMQKQTKRMSKRNRTDKATTLNINRNNDVKRENLEINGSTKNKTNQNKTTKNRHKQPRTKKANRRRQ